MKKTFAFEHKEKDNWFVIAFNFGEKSDNISLYFNEQKISYAEILSGEKGSFFSKNKLGLNSGFIISGRSALIYQIHSYNN
jgi:hypothetical protein